jgi:O-acetyl-ADP-ribose deacetylase (regulator of RNase III)
MIEAGSGNLLACDAEALVNTVNTVGVMGKGIALQFKRAYPANFRAYRAACERGSIRIGEMFLFDTAINGPRRYLINFPTKRHWKSPSRMADIEAGLDDLVRVATEHKITSLAIPALGCGNGGLDWETVRPAIEKACARIPAVRSVIFAPSGPPSPTSMPNATSRPRLTPLRALLMVAIGRYQDRARTQEARDGISELEIQKVAYFLKAFGADYPLKFTQGKYGPYAETLPHVLNTLEGHYLTGYGDRTARVTELVPITPTTGGLSDAESIMRTHPEDAARVDRLLDLVDGFETPYSMELLATVHFASTQPPTSTDPAILADRVAGWNRRKARLFTYEHVQVAARQLAERDLLPS